MSKVFYIKDFLVNRDKVRDDVQPSFKDKQLSLFPEPQFTPTDYYYLIDIKNETDVSLREFLAKTHPTVICEVRDVPNFYTRNLSRNKFFQILNSLNVRYVYPTGLGSPAESGICYLVDDESVDSELLIRRVIELQNIQLVN